MRADRPPCYTLAMPSVDAVSQLKFKVPADLLVADEEDLLDRDERWDDMWTRVAQPGWGRRIGGEHYCHFLDVYRPRGIAGVFVIPSDNGLRARLLWRTVAGCYFRQLTADETRRLVVHSDGTLIAWRNGKAAPAPWRIAPTTQSWRPSSNSRARFENSANSLNPTNPVS